jgi:hypothetical protein
MSEPKIDIMLDLETFGTKNHSVIISIGAVWFDPAKRGDDAILGNFGIAIDPINSQQRGLRIDADTVMWWMQPAQRMAWDEWVNTLKFPLDTSIDLFSEWVFGCLKTANDAATPSPDTATYDATEHVRVWGNGPQFDCGLLRNAYEVCQRDAPWKHFNERCFRTMKNLPDAKLLWAPKHVGLLHNALVDARQQALWLCEILHAKEVQTT